MRLMTWLHYDAVTMRHCRLLLLIGTVVCAVLAHTQAAPAPIRPALLVLNKTDNNLAIVDLRTFEVAARVPVGAGPHEVVASTDGALAFAANYGDGSGAGQTISVIDLATQKELRRVDVSPLRRPHGLAFANGKLYFTSETSRIVARYDPASNQIDWMFGTGQTTTHMVHATPDAATLYTANIGGNSISIIERAANPATSIITTIPVGRGPEGFDVSPNGKELWAAHSQDGGISVIDLATKKVTATIDAKTRRSNRLKFTTDGARALVSDLDAGEIVVLDAATRAVTSRMPIGASPEGILIDPDGTRAFIAVTGDNNIAVLDLKTMTVTRRIQTGGGPDGMALIK
jgi:YVTN family beta-propeller protein